MKPFKTTPVTLLLEKKLLLAVISTSTSTERLDMDPLKLRADITKVRPGRKRRTLNYDYKPPFTPSKMVKNAVRHREDWNFDGSLHAEVHDAVAGIEKRIDLEAEDWHPALENVTSESKIDWTQAERKLAKQNRLRERHGLDPLRIRISDGITYSGSLQGFLATDYKRKPNRHYLRRMSKAQRARYYKWAQILAMLDAGLTRADIQAELGCSRKELDAELGKIGNMPGVGWAWLRSLGASKRYAKDRSKLAYK